MITSSSYHARRAGRCRVRLISGPSSSLSFPFLPSLPFRLNGFHCAWTVPCDAPGSGRPCLPSLHFQRSFGRRHRSPLSARRFETPDGMPARMAALRPQTACRPESRERFSTSPHSSTWGVPNPPFRCGPGVLEWGGSPVSGLQSQQTASTGWPPESIPDSRSARGSSGKRVRIQPHSKPPIPPIEAILAHGR
jgi:hypothetical protein